MKRFVLPIFSVWFGIAVLSLTAAFSGMAYGDNCVRSRAVYTQTYYQAPTYQYTPTYQNYQQQYTILVPKVLEVETYANHSYSIDSYYQQSLLADAIVGRLMRMQQITGAQPAADQQSSVQPRVVAPSSVVSPEATAGAPAASTIDRSRPSAYQSPELIAVVQTSCQKCHTGAKRMPLLTADGKALLDLPKVQALDCFFRVTVGNMPKSSPPLDDKFMPLVAKWVESSK